MIKNESDTSWKEMYQVFNMGHRFEIYVYQDFAEDIMHIAKEFGMDAQIIGECYKSNDKKLTIRSQYGEFEYI